MWDSLWNDPAYRRNDVWGLEKELRGARWKRMSALVAEKLGGFADAEVVELGAGAGKVALLCALEGANVTLVDYSQGALDRARTLFEQFGQEATYILQDLFDLDPGTLPAFDLSISFGLTEHFREERRVLINRAHLDVLRPGGLTIISVPNAANPPYRIYKAVTEALGIWKYGDEFPYAQSEFVALMERFGVQQYGFFGDSFFDSFRFFNPIGSPRKALGLKPATRRGTPLDARYGYALACWAVKPSADTD